MGRGLTRINADKAKNEIRVFRVYPRPNLKGENFGSGKQT